MNFVLREQFLTAELSIFLNFLTMFYLLFNYFTNISVFVLKLLLLSPVIALKQALELHNAHVN